MWASILAFFKGGKFAVVMAGIAAVAVTVWRGLASVKQAGRDEQKAKEAEGYERNVGKAADALRARDGVMSGRVREDDSDPNRRD